MLNELLTILAILQSALVICLPSGPITAITSSSSSHIAHHPLHLHQSHHLQHQQQLHHHLPTYHHHHHHHNYNQLPHSSLPLLSSTTLQSAVQLAFAPSLTTSTSSSSSSLNGLSSASSSQSHRYLHPPFASKQRLLHRIQLLRALQNNLHLVNAYPDHSLHYSLASNPVIAHLSPSDLQLQSFQTNFNQPLSSSSPAVYSALALAPTASLLPFQPFHSSKYSTTSHPTASITSTISFPSSNSKQASVSPAIKPKSIKVRKSPLVITSSPSPIATAYRLEPVKSVESIVLPPNVTNVSSSPVHTYPLQSTLPSLSLSSSASFVVPTSAVVSLSSSLQPQIKVTPDLSFVTKSLLPQTVNQSTQSSHLDPQLFELESENDLPVNSDDYSVKPPHTYVDESSRIASQQIESSESVQSQVYQRSKFAYNVIPSHNKSSLLIERKKLYERTAPDTSASVFSRALGTLTQYLPSSMRIGRNSGCVGGTKCQFFLSCWVGSGSLGSSCGPLSTCCITPSKQDIQPAFYGPVINDPHCGRSAARISRIVGGTDASFGQFPWQAFVQVGGSRCGGALVGSKHVVTAGHCVARSQHNPSDIRVTLGDYILNSDIESLPHELFSVAEVRLHPNFRFTPQADRYDVAILVLDRQVEYRNNIKPICLPQKDANFLGRVAYVAGWGALQAGSKLRPKVLQHVNVPVIDNNVCELWHRKRGINIKIHDEMMCAGYEFGGRDACQGDSGGPLMLNEYGVWYLIGIVSAGYSCAKQYQPGIYHRVSASSDWVSANIYHNTN